MWLWIIVALVCLLLLIVLILCIPVDLVFSLTINESPAYKVRLLWFFGWIDTELRRKKDTFEKKKVPVKAAQKHKPQIRFRTIYRILKTRGLWSQFMQLITGILKSIKIQELKAYLKLSLENPADMGLLFAVAAPINSLLHFLPYSIAFYPSFDNDFFFEAHAQGITRLHPVRVVFALLRFLFSLPVISAVMIFMVSRWKRA